MYLILELGSFMYAQVYVCNVMYLSIAPINDFELIFPFLGPVVRPPISYNTSLSLSSYLYELYLYQLSRSLPNPSMDR